MDLLEIYNDDCFNVFSKMKDNSIDLFVLDLPYANKKFGNCTSCKWDTPVDLGKMWIEIKRIMKPKAVLCFFCNTKFGFTLIESNPKWFRYDLVWKKSRKVGFLSANKRQLRNHENIYVFGDKPGSYNPQKIDGEPYTAKQGTHTDIYGKQDEGTITENKGDRHPCSVIEHENVYVFGDKAGTYNPQKVDGEPYDRMSKGTNVDCFNGTVYDTKTKFKPVKNDGYRHPCSVIEDENTSTHENVYVFGDKAGTYNPQKIDGEPYKTGGRKSMGYYGDCGDKYLNTGEREYDGQRHPASVIEHENVYVFGDKVGTYNPQKKPGKPYTTKHKNSFCELYGKKRTDSVNTGDRHPSSVIEDDDTTHENTILEYKSVYKTIHKTEKPVGLLEYLIKSYSNEGDTVMDFTMGSASCGEACFNTKRKFIGVERDDDIFLLAQERLSNLEE